MIAQLLTKKPVNSLRDLDYIVPDIYYPVLTKQVVRLPFYVVKSHEPFRYFGPSHQYRRVLYIIRDPRDVAVSYYRYASNNGWKRGDLRRFALDFSRGRVFPGSWQEHVESWTKSDAETNIQLKIIKYEDIIDTPIDTLAEISRFLGIEANPDEISRAVLQSQSEDMRKKELMGNRAVQDSGKAYFIGAAKARSWVDHLDPESIREIESLARITMEKYGYLRNT